MKPAGTISLLLLIAAIGALCQHREASPAGLARIKVERDRPSFDFAGTPSQVPPSQVNYDPYFIPVNDFRFPHPLLVHPSP